MSVNTKLDSFEAVAEEFEQFVNRFEKDSEQKWDLADLHGEVESTRRYFETTEDAFADYRNSFTGDVDAFRDAIITQRQELQDCQDEFEEYNETFQGDVENLLDVQGFLSAIADMQTVFSGARDEFEGYGETFQKNVETHREDVETKVGAYNDYGPMFMADVEEIQDIGAMIDAIQALEQEYNETEDSFKDYVDAFRTAVDSVEGEIEIEAEELAEFARRFQNEDVEAFIDAVEEFEAQTAESLAAFEGYTKTFYGFDLPETATEAESEPESAEVSEGEPSTSTDSEARSEVESVPDGETPDKSELEAEQESPRSPSKAPDVEEETERNETTESVEETEFEQEEDVDAAGKTVESTEAEPEDMVMCKICGEYFKAITEPHLQTHDLTIEKYRDEYGEDVPLRPKEK